ncbi:MAG: DoxX family protein [Bacteroidota bacterium]
MKRIHHLLIGGAGGADAVADAGLLVLRLTAGLAMAFAHGLGKVPPAPGFVELTAGLGFPLPGLFAWAAGLAELAGGLLIAVGLLTRPAAFFLLFTMGVAFFLQHGGDPFGEREMAFLYGAFSLTLLLTGAGRFSLDALLQSRVRRSGERFFR